MPEIEGSAFETVQRPGDGTQIQEIDRLDDCISVDYAHKTAA